MSNIGKPTELMSQKEMTTLFGGEPTLQKMPSDTSAAAANSAYSSGDADYRGVLIINADDWGRERETTDRILDCIRCGAVSSASGMVFMEDSERAACVARERGIDIGLHLNFTTPFSSPASSRRLTEHQQRLSRCLAWHRYSQVLFHPGLAASFDYVIAAQLDEFRRLYGTAPERLDGHHHMHLCTNVLVGRLLPAGTIVRRSFSFRPGEKSRGNRLYRQCVDRVLAKRHRIVDYFFSLFPLVPVGRVQRMFSLARQFAVEVETHPANAAEYRFLRQGEIFRAAEDIQIARRYGPLKA